MKTSNYLVSPGKKIRLSDYSTNDTLDLKSKEDATKLLEKNIENMRELQDKLYASNIYSLLIIFQAMDAAGKDGTIKHVMSGLNPQGTQVYSFKQPSKEELDHGYLWRIYKALPERGRIGIFNRSHYEEVLVVKVHNLIRYQQLPSELVDDKIWQRRYEQINNFEKYLHENGTVVLKFFLNISKDEQKKRFLKRIEDPAKHWKFSADDINERKYWNEYHKAYEDAINATSKDYAPWYVIPADKKWFTRLVVSEIIVETLEKLNLDYPKVSDEWLTELNKCKEILLKEKD
ncbi:MAG TPA: polyphosphate kinase 2 family protein [Ignavibacteriaceae bacterium]|jgi:PPK2 family polyphosphate:nucleotide phosphotransferase|nr:MAG: Polyphosphate kinase 2 (PPK2) [Ignavibacteria bacterium ADurb.Bin266]OQY73664.1 MAG: polyphosphate--nucleotide phosphotransferase [Ignavibacteriales bacterium UTCHB2]HQF41455.1 polyphosphate kinase 2 family protein [Ignavibacteriaceae bacterium]HQI40564.1 polyphosphate kinase 2 family protein [Ignavibacteriaceae bacterium]